MPKQYKPTSHVSDEGSLELTEEIIRSRAYQLFVERGYENGHDLDDWLQAEAEIMGKPQKIVSVEEEEKLHELAAV